MDQKNRGNDELSSSNLSDEEIVERLKVKKDRSFQSELYDRYIDRVFFKCLSITNDSSLARDFAHDIFTSSRENPGCHYGYIRSPIIIVSGSYNDRVRSYTAMKSNQMKFRSIQPKNCLSEKSLKIRLSY